METLQNRLVALVKDAPPEALDRVQRALAQGSTHLQSLTDIPGYLLVPLNRAWKAIGVNRVPPEALGLALESVRAMKERVESEQPRLDLVWTGPHSPSNVHTKTTQSVLKEMIEGARFRILVVSYDLTQHNALSSSVVEALAAARARGRKVTVALHDNDSNFNSITELWPRQLPLPRLLKWGGSSEGRYAKLHAKLVAVDSEDLLITSANLTLHGLEHNIEVGVRVRGQFAAEVDRHFGNLESEGVLVPYQGATR